MGPLDATWHLLNFFAPALGVAVVASLLAKLLWRGELRAVPLKRLVIAGSAAGAIALVASLVAFGRDGRMAGHGMLVAACAAALWWSAFRTR
jgi:hypothetical protein